MNIDRRKFVLSGAALAVTVGTVPAEARTAPVDGIRVVKSKRQLDLMNGRTVLKRYRIQLGENPVGPKRFQGDYKTPEGVFRINRRNQHSFFYRSLGLDYPHREHREFARRHGRSAGGDIFIHGQHPNVEETIWADWTRGCIAMDNQEMAEVFRYVPVGCRIVIHP